MTADLRSTILHTIEQYPGLHLREIQRRCDCSPMLAEYHLNVLEKLSLVTSSKEGRYRHFFPKRHEPIALDATDKRWLSILRRPPILAMTLVLLEKGLMRPMEMATELDLPSSTASYQIRVARKSGLFADTEADGGDKLRVADAARVLELLQAHHPTPDVMSDYASLWNKVFDRPARPPVEPEPLDENIPDIVAAMPRAAHAVYRALMNGPLTQKQLCLETGHARRTVYGALRKLEQAGLLDSHVHLLDTRQNKYVLKDERGRKAPENKA